MSRVTKYDICSRDKESKTETRMYLWLTDKGKDNKERKKIISIDVNDRRSKGEIMILQNELCNVKIASNQNRHG